MKAPVPTRPGASGSIVARAGLLTRRSPNTFGSTDTFRLSTLQQVLGGRWKPLHYWYSKFLFTDVGVACGVSGACYVKNGWCMTIILMYLSTTAYSFRPDPAFPADNPLTPLGGLLNVSVLRLTDGHVSAVSSQPFNLSVGAGSTQWFCVDGSLWPCAGYDLTLSNASCKPDASNCVLLLDVIDFGSGTSVVSSHELLSPPSSLALPPASVTVTSVEACGGSGACVSLAASAPALYVVLTTQAQGHFSDNAFIMRGGPLVVNFTFFGPQDVAFLSSTLRVEHAQMYTGPA